MAHPGGNITGFSNFEYSMSGKWAELLKQITPHVTRALVLRDPTSAAGIGQFAGVRSVAQSLGVELTPSDVRDTDEIERDAAAFARSGNGGAAGAAARPAAGVVAAAGAAARPAAGVVAAADAAALPAAGVVAAVDAAVRPAAGVAAAADAVARSAAGVVAPPGPDLVALGQVEHR
jgi:hypothetical protein